MEIKVSLEVAESVAVEVIKQHYAIVANTPVWNKKDKKRNEKLLKSMDIVLTYFMDDEEVREWNVEKTYFP